MKSLPLDSQQTETSPEYGTCTGRDKVVGLIWRGKKWGLDKRGFLRILDSRVSVSASEIKDTKSGPGSLQTAVDQISFDLFGGSCGS